MFQIDETDRIVRPTEAARLLGASRSTLWRLEQEGRLPKRVHVSDRIAGWWMSDLVRFVNGETETPEVDSG